MSMMATVGGMLTTKEVARLSGLTNAAISQLNQREQFIPILRGKNGAPSYYDAEDVRLFAALYRLGVTASTAAQLAQSGRVHVADDGTVTIEPLTKAVHDSVIQSEERRQRPGA